MKNKRFKNVGRKIKLPLLLFYIIMPLLVFSQKNNTENKDSSLEQSQNQSFVKSFKVFGEVFGDYYYKTGGSNNPGIGTSEYCNVKKDAQAFAFRRIYFGSAFEFSPKFEGKIMLESNDDQLLPNGKKSAGNLKYAYIKWKEIYKGASLILGAQSTLTWSRFTEKIWGYRSIEKTIFDARKLGSSNDVGISLAGKLLNEKIGYNLMIGNGQGQKPENNRFKKFYFSVNGKEFDKHLLWEVYLDYEDQNPVSWHWQTNKTTIKGFLGYQTAGLTAGIEGGKQAQENYGVNIDTLISKIDTVNVVPTGYTFFVKGNIIKDKLNAFVRFDLWNPDSKVSNDGWKEYFTVIGIDFTPTKNVHFMPNLWVNMYDNKNGKDTRLADVVPRLTFWWKFK